jgi:hypothetical protein
MSTYDVGSSRPCAGIGRNSGSLCCDRAQRENRGTVSVAEDTLKFGYGS